MAQITTKAIVEINELAIKDIEQYAMKYAEQALPGYRMFAHNLIIAGGYHTLNYLLEYLIKQLEEEQK